MVERSKRPLRLTFANIAVTTWIYTYIRRSHVEPSGFDASKLLFTVPAEKWSQSENCATEAGKQAAKENATSKLKIIVASTKHSGTYASTKALKMLGLNTFDTERTFMYAEPLLTDGLAPAMFLKVVNRCQAEALILDPVVDALPLALSTSPAAKVIMAWKDFPSFKRSLPPPPDERQQNQYHRLARVCTSGNEIFPWMNLLEHAGAFTQTRRKAVETTDSPFAYIQRQMRWRTGGAIVGQLMMRGTNKIAVQEEAYLAHMDEIRQSVPADRLLEFDESKHGWRELERFTGRSPPAGSAFPKQSAAKNTWSGDPELHTLAGYAAMALWSCMHIPNQIALAIVLGILLVPTRRIWRFLRWFFRDTSNEPWAKTKKD